MLLPCVRIEPTELDDTTVFCARSVAVCVVQQQIWRRPVTDRAACLHRSCFSSLLIYIRCIIPTGLGTALCLQLYSLYTTSDGRPISSSRRLAPLQSPSLTNFDLSRVRCTTRCTLRLTTSCTTHAYNKSK